MCPAHIRKSIMIRQTLSLQHENVFNNMSREILLCKGLKEIRIAGSPCLPKEVNKQNFNCFKINHSLSNHCSAGAINKQNPRSLLQLKHVLISSLQCS